MRDGFGNEYRADVTDVEEIKRLVRSLHTGPMSERDFQLKLRERYKVWERLGVLRTALAQMADAGEIQRKKKNSRTLFVRVDASG